MKICISCILHRLSPNYTELRRDFWQIKPQLYLGLKKVWWKCLWKYFNQSNLTQPNIWPTVTTYCCNKQNESTFIHLLNEQCHLASKGGWNLCYAPASYEPFLFVFDDFYLKETIKFTPIWSANFPTLKNWINEKHLFHVTFYFLKKISSIHVQPEIKFLLAIFPV